jgi:hypothetical protein
MKTAAPLVYSPAYRGLTPSSVSDRTLYTNDNPYFTPIYDPQNYVRPMNVLGYKKNNVPEVPPGLPQPFPTFVAREGPIMEKIAGKLPTMIISPY